MMSAELDCNNISARIKEKNKESESSSFLFLFLLTELYLDCLEKIQNNYDQPFPKATEITLFDKIKTQLQPIASDLIRSNVEGHRNIEAILDGYEVDQDVDLKKLSMRSLLASYIKISEEITSRGSDLSERWKDWASRVAKRKDQISFDYYDKHFLDLTRDVHSLYQIFSIIDSTGTIFKQQYGKVSVEEKRLVLQRVFHVIGEYIKNTEKTSNLSQDVGKYLEENGIPLRYLSEFRDLLAHHVLPVIHLNNVQIEELFNKGLFGIKEIARNQIVELEKDFIMSIINPDKFKSDGQSFGEEFKKRVNENGIKGLIEYIKTIRGEYATYNSLPKALRESISKIDKTAQFMKSNGFSIEKKEFSPVERGEIASEISASVTQFIHESSLTMYNEVKAEIVSWRLDKNMGNFDIAHDDVVKITNVIDYLRYGIAVSPNNVIDDFLSKTEVLEKIILFNNISLKGELQRYFDVKSFKEKRSYYNLPKDIEVGSLVELLNSVEGPSENKSKVIKFLKSVSAYQIIASNYVPPDEYKTLVDSLTINDSGNKQKLSSFSVDLEKVQSLNRVLEDHDQGTGELANFFKSIESKIQGGENIKIGEYQELLNSLYPDNYDKEKLLSSSAELLQLKQVKTLADLLSKVEQNVSKLTNFFKSINSGNEGGLSRSKYSKLVKELSDGKNVFIEVRKQLQHAESLVGLLTPINESASKLSKFLESVSAYQNIASNYIPPDEYNTLVNSLIIDDSKNKEKLLSFSGEWEKVKSSIDLLNTIDWSNEVKVKLINFFRSTNPNQGAGGNYVSPDEYEKLIDGLSIHTDSKEKLLLFSVEWRKKQCINLLAKNPPALKEIYDSIIVGKSVSYDLYQKFAYQSQLSNENPISLRKRVSSLKQNVPGKIQNLWSSRVEGQVKMLKGLSNPYAVEAQFINIYSLLEKTNIVDQTDHWVIRKLRNNLSHTKGSQLFREQLLQLMTKAAIQLDISKQITISSFDDAVSSTQSELGLSEIRKVFDGTGTGSNSGSSKQNLNFCLRRRQARNIIGCLFSKDDVEKFSKEKVDENNVDKVIIDSEKFLTYVRSSQDEEKNSQLLKFIGDKSIEGDYRYLIDRVIQDQGYERYIQNERIKDLYGDIAQQDVSSTKRSKLKGRLMNAAGRIQLIMGIHGTIVSCGDGTATDCGLSVGGMVWSLASQPIENVIVKTAPKAVASAGHLVGKMIPGTLGKQSQFAVTFYGAKFGSKIAKGVAGAVGGVFDIVDIGRSASKLVDCKNRENSDSPCGEKEIRDNIASISFSGVSFISGVALAAASMPVAGIAVGFVVMVGQGIYNGVSNIIEYEEKYDTTHDENWRIFWHTIFLQPMPQHVQHLAARSDIVNFQAKRAWENLCKSPNDVVAYGIGFGVDSDTPSLLPGYGKIMMSRTDADTTNLSRVIPKSIQNATMICLPQVTREIYEKSSKKSVPTAVHYCENTMVITDKRRIQNGKTILYDLESIDRGTIVGSNTLNNDFLIFNGSTTITGGSYTDNKFIFLKPIREFFGRIIGGYNATNIIDLSQSTENDYVVKVKINYYPLSDGRAFILRLVANHCELVDDAVDGNVDTFKYLYIGKQSQVTNVACTYDSQRLTTNDKPDVFVDSRGGLSKDDKDIIDNCKKVAVSPYTKVTGVKNNYTFYIKTVGYKDKELYSEIDVEGKGTIIFPETNLLNDCSEIAYSSKDNTLSLKIGLGQSNQYTLDIKNYIKQGSDQPNFTLIDKSGSNIIPKIEKLESPITIINSFELHAEYPFNSFDAAENHYKKILSNNKGYKVFGVLRKKLRSQSNSAFQCMMFGSSVSDIINFDERSMFARGGNGSDTYAIDGNTDKREIIIDNNSDDEILDVLVMPEVPERFLVQQCDLYLSSSNTNVQVRNYLQNNKYRHLMFMSSSKGEIFIPYVQSMSCAGSSFENGKLVPFFHATPNRNLFLLSKDFQDNHVVIDSRLEEIERYKDKDDLLLVREGEIPFIIKIEDFYNDRLKWEDVNFLLWNNGNFSPYSGLYQEVDGVMDYQDKLKNDYEKSVKEYVIDFTHSVNITHNQDDTLTSVREDEKRIGVMILKDIGPDRIQVSSSDRDLVLSDKVSKYVINVKNWNYSESYRISRLEFDLGLEPIMIRKLDLFSLSDLAAIQDLVNQASEICQQRAKLELNKQLLAAVQDGDFSKVKGLVNRCISINAKQKDGSTPLHYAAINGNVGVVRYMVEEGADFNIKDKSKRIPLHLAAIYGKLEVVKYLKNRGAAFNLKDIFERTPLHSAVMNGRLKVVKYLVEEGASVNDKDVSGRTPLDFAVRKGHKNIVEFLEQTQLDKKLLTATADEDLAKVRYFVSRGANVNATDKDGRTSLDIARNKGNNIIVNYLEAELNKERGKPAQRKRRHHHGDHNLRHNHLLSKPLAIAVSNQAEIATSSSIRSSSWINDLFGWVKSSIGGLFNSRSALPEETLNNTTRSSLSQVDTPTDVNGTIILLDLFIRKFTDQKHIFSVDQNISLLEAQGYALNITKGFEKAVEQAAFKSDISMYRLNIDFVGMQEEVTKKVIGGKFDEISEILKQHIEKACPIREAGCPGKLSSKKFDKFIAAFNNISIDKSIQQILYNSKNVLEREDIQQQRAFSPVNKKPKRYLNNFSTQCLT